MLESDGSGSYWYYERQALASEAIAKMAGDLGDGIVPFASDVDGNLYVVDSGRKDAVFEWDGDGRGAEVCHANTNAE